MQASENKREIIEEQRKNLTAFSYKTRESALLVLEKMAIETQSNEIKIEVVDALQENILNFMTGGTAIASIELIGKITVQAKDTVVAQKAIEVLTNKLEFSFTRSAHERNAAAKSLKDIAGSYRGNQKIDEMLYDAFLPHVDSGLGPLSKIARDLVL